MKWEEIYSLGRQLNHYPFDEVISFVRRYGKSGQSILELGCGAGNNLIWCVKEGFKITGIDSSESAINYARKKALKDGLYEVNYTFIHDDFANFPGTYDLIIDRYATTYLKDKIEIVSLNDKINNRLNPGGYYFTQLASSANTLELDPIPHYYTAEDVGELFQTWEIISLKHRVDSDILTEKHFAVWNLIARKR